MPIAQQLLPEFDHEMATTRTLLARVPDAAASWRPHAKSMSMGELAQHIVNVVQLAHPIVHLPAFDFAAPEAKPYVTPKYTSTTALVDMFDRNVKIARDAIGAAADPAMGEGWTLRAGPKTIMSLPRAATLRTLILSHIIHHRGQLSVYLRLNEVPVPAIYGQSADETR